MGDVRVTQIHNLSHLLSRTFVKQGAFRALNWVMVDSRGSCAWSCGALSRRFRSGADVGSESSSSCWEVRPLCSTSGIVGFVMVGPLCPCTVCCHASSAAWAAFRNYNMAVGFPVSSRASRKAAEAASTGVYSRAERCSTGRKPAAAACRIMSTIRDLAAMTEGNIH